MFTTWFTVNKGTQTAMSFNSFNFEASPVTPSHNLNKSGFPTPSSCTTRNIFTELGHILLQAWDKVTKMRTINLFRGAYVNFLISSESRKNHLHTFQPLYAVRRWIFFPFHDQVSRSDAASSLFGYARDGWTLKCGTGWACQQQQDND
jgi:hypothetical protein